MFTVMSDFEDIDTNKMFFIHFKIIDRYIMQKLSVQKLVNKKSKHKIVVGPINIKQRKKKVK